jgi:hypothetical protein
LDNSGYASIWVLPDMMIDPAPPPANARLFPYIGGRFLAVYDE